jgi:uncharacterized glyoxalase superfamily metalloenzyme YdcJ
MAPGGKPKKAPEQVAPVAPEAPEQVAPVAVADQEHAPEGSPPDAPASSLKRTSAEAVEENRMMTYFKRIKTGAAKRASEGEVQQATQALDVFKDLQPTQRGAFVKLFLDSKASKDFGFVKEYAEELITSQEHKETITENYLTRIDMYAQL